MISDVAMLRNIRIHFVHLADWMKIQYNLKLWLIHVHVSTCCAWIVSGTLWLGHTSTTGYDNHDTCET